MSQSASVTQVVAQGWVYIPGYGTCLVPVAWQAWSTTSC